jgi:hypothetical protein
MKTLNIMDEQLQELRRSVPPIAAAFSGTSCMRFTDAVMRVRT